MGLDMYLKGKVFHWTDWNAPEGKRRPMKDGFEVSELTLDLGYWRKHPDLHGYIVGSLANGLDECQKIELYEKDLQKIIEAIKSKDLPTTQGFSFGESDGTEDKESIAIFEKALKWLKKRKKNQYKSVFYQASW